MISCDFLCPAFCQCNYNFIKYELVIIFNKRSLTVFPEIMAIPCCQSTAIPRVSGLSEKDFHELYFVPAKPVIITDATDDWPARSWTIENLVCQSAS